MSNKMSQLRLATDVLSMRFDQSTAEIIALEEAQSGFRKQVEVVVTKVTESPHGWLIHWNTESGVKKKESSPAPGILPFWVTRSGSIVAFGFHMLTTEPDRCLRVLERVNGSHLLFLIGECFWLIREKLFVCSRGYKVSDRSHRIMEIQSKLTDPQADHQ